MAALQLDDRLPEAHAALALIVQNHDYDWQTAEKEFKRAIELNPNYATAHHWYSEHLTWRGRFDEALRESERARQLDPLSLIIAADNGATLYYSRQYDRAIAQFTAVRELDPNFPRARMILYAYVQKGEIARQSPSLRKKKCTSLKPRAYPIDATGFTAAEQLQQCPTSTPATSVIASSGPVGRMPTFSPKSETRGRALGVVFCAAAVIQQWVKTRYGVRVLILVVPHTFGRHLNFNAHLHVMVSAGGLKESEGRWITPVRFDRRKLMHMWRYAVIMYLRAALKKGSLGSEASPEELRVMLKAQWFIPGIRNRRANFAASSRPPLRSATCR